MNQQPTNVTITKARLWQLNLPLKHPFASSEGTVTASGINRQYWAPRLW